MTALDLWWTRTPITWHAPLTDPLVLLLPIPLMTQAYCELHRLEIKGEG